MEENALCFEMFKVSSLQWCSEGLGKEGGNGGKRGTSVTCSTIKLNF